MSFGPHPWRQTAWDARAAANFMAGGAGSGLIVASALAGGPGWLSGLGALLVALGLLSVWAEIGRPWRALHVFFNPRTSWMTREGLLAPALLPLAAAAALGLPGAAGATWTAAALALGFVYCQGRILRAARGIPAWREPTIVPLIVATGLAEGAALWLLLAARPAAWPVWAGFATALLARQWLWTLWRRRIAAAPRALAAADAAGRWLQAGTLVPLAAAVLALGAPLPAAAAWALQLAAGALALAAGLWFKFTLVTRTGFNQGFALPHLPVRGVRRQEG
jgi:phenylacetyl-CoA:acceptor oxidoreductase 26-kDa subunit